MRTIAEIKDSMTAEFIKNPAVITKYELKSNKTFDEQFSKVSIESILFYLFATCVWVLEQMFVQFQIGIETKIAEQKVHRPRWYRNKTLAFRDGQGLLPDSDTYSNVCNDTGRGLTAEQIAERQIIKYAAVSEARDRSKLFIKVAGEENGERKPISEHQKKALESYLYDIADAGVYVEIINRDADRFYLNMTIFYDPLILKNTGESVSTPNVFPVLDAIKQYIQNLPFNGEFSKMELENTIQNISGVSDRRLDEARYSYGGHQQRVIQLRCQPDAGYFKVYYNEDIKITYVAR
jgi:hypothetical protein